MTRTALKIRCEACDQQYSIPYTEIRAILDMRIDFAQCTYCGYARSPELAWRYRRNRWCKSCNVPEPFSKIHRKGLCTTCSMADWRATRNVPDEISTIAT